MPWAEKVRQKLRGLNVDVIGEDIEDAIQPLVLEVVSWIPIVSQYNDILIVIKGENIYRQKSDDLDTKLAIVSLITFWGDKIIPVREIKYAAEHLKRGASAMSTTHSLQKSYETKSQENH
jgi:hypothetical protein